MFGKSGGGFTAELWYTVKSSPQEWEPIHIG
jgi:hypothetical protein